jgi:diguanylate cyclase (GGDEF)-like protein
MLDLDLFKIVNDTYGHMAGDLVLRETAQRLSASVRAYDAVSRYGGEEFLIVSPGCPAAGAANLAERIRKVVGEKPMNTSEALISITISVGIATAEYVDKRATFTKNVGEYTEAENLVRAADDAMYRAKRWGRNRVEWNTVYIMKKL